LYVSVSFPVGSRRCQDIQFGPISHAVR
jgi:hypothetical protein